jgi:colanic acid/amylovoran biosynthesis glycosyltransferase
MNSPVIAILCPQTGNLTETFVHKHTMLIPGSTVVITGNKLHSKIAQWQTECPTLALNAFPQRYIYAIARRVGLVAVLNKFLIKRFLQKHKVTHALGEYLDFSTQWVSILKELNIPYYVHSYGYDVSENLQQQFWRKKYLKLNDPIVKAIINEADFVKDSLTGIGINEHKCITITSCPEIPGLFLHRKEKPLISLIFSGRLVAKKNPLPLLAAFAKALQIMPQLRLTLIGDGPLHTAVFAYIKENKLSDTVTCYGALPNTAVIEAMQAADIFISHHTTDPLTGDKEGLPVTILEAMGQGLPVISTIHAGIPDCINNGEEGFLVAPEDADVMAAKIILLASNHQLRITMGQKAWKRAYEDFSWKKEKESLLKLMGITQ